MAIPSTPTMLRRCSHFERNVIKVKRPAPASIQFRILGHHTWRASAPSAPLLRFITWCETPAAWAPTERTPSRCGSTKYRVVPPPEVQRSESVLLEAGSLVGAGGF